MGPGGIRGSFLWAGWVRFARGGLGFVSGFFL